MTARMLLLASLVALTAHADSAQLTIANALSTVDTEATSSQLSTLFMQNSVTMLPPYALNSGNVYSVGIQLGAIHMLGTYCATTTSGCAGIAETTLEDIVDVQVAPYYCTAQSGSSLLVCRAAIESLGQLGNPGDLANLTPFLGHPSRDIRAAAARALKYLGTTCAITPLRDRYAVESTDQVRFAITDALDTLSNPSLPACPPPN